MFCKRELVRQKYAGQIDAADGKFDGVQSPTALQFPLALAEPAHSSAEVQAAQAAAQSARMLAYVGIGCRHLGSARWGECLAVPPVRAHDDGEHTGGQPASIAIAGTINHPAGMH
jgi:hypothetical protein